MPPGRTHGTVTTLWFFFSSSEKGMGFSSAAWKDRNIFLSIREKQEAAGQRDLVGLGLSSSLADWESLCPRTRAEKTAVTGKRVLKWNRRTRPPFSGAGPKEHEIKCSQISQIPHWTISWALKLKEEFFYYFDSYIWILTMQVCVLYSDGKKEN